MRRVLLASVLAPTGAAVLAAQESAVELRTTTGTLHGTLRLPATAQATFPVALIIAGSGPTDRDGNSAGLPGKNNSLQQVAELLAEQGVASVRYDKRGVAGSRGAATSESDLRFTHFVDDAADWARQLAVDARFSRLMLVGHSEGSLIALLAAQQAPVDRVISLAGAGRSAAVVLEEQLARNLTGPLLEEARRAIAELSAGRTVTASPVLAALFRPSVQPYLISWLTIDPAAEAAKLDVPLLVVQGSTDIQVSRTDAERLASASPKAQLVLIEGMNHVLKDVRDPAKQMASYSDPALPLHGDLRAAVAAFVAAPPE